MNRTPRQAMLICIACLLISLSFGCRSASSDVATADPSLKLLATVDLTKLEKGRGMLDAQYCGRNDLVYDVTITARPNWTSGPNVPSHALFTLGRNMHGQMPNSVSLLVWEGQSLFARMTSSTMSDTAQVIVGKPPITQGQPLNVHARWTHNCVSFDVNGKHQGDSTLAGEFVWPANRPYYVGFEDDGYTPWDGTIDEGTLRIYEPRIRAAFVGGNDAGYFQGRGPHDLAISLPVGDGKVVVSSLDVADIEGHDVIAAQAPSNVRERQQSFRLNNLPYGWYQATVTIKAGDAEVKIARPFVITTGTVDREEAAISPFGVANEFGTDYATYDPAVTDVMMSRMQAMGVRWFRFWLNWNSIQKTPDSFDWRALDDIADRAAKHGLTLYACLVGGKEKWQSYEAVQKSPYPIMSPQCYMPRDLALWEKYISALATRYKGRLSYYQVWNEADARNGFYPFRTEDYVNVLKVTSEAIRAVDPRATIGLSGFAGGFGEGGIKMLTHTDKNSAWGLGEFWALKPQSYYDVMDCHFYSCDQPGQSWDVKAATALNLRKAMTANGDGAKPLWNSETSFLTGVPGKIGGWANVPLLSGKDQAARLVQMHVQSLAVGIAHTMWYSIRGDCGVLNTDFSPLPSYAAHVELARQLKGMCYDRTLDLGSTARGYVFRNGRKRFVALWTTSGKASLTLAGVNRAAIIDMFGNVSALPISGNVVLTTNPIYIAVTDGDKLAATLASQ